MNWVNIINTALATTGIVGVTLAILGWIAKSLYEQVLSIDLESHKADLNLEAEKFRANLERTVFEHSVRFENLHVKRAEIIAELYSKISYAEISATTFIEYIKDSGELSYEETSTIAQNTAKDLMSFFRVNKIYFDKSLCESIDSFIDELIKRLAQFESEISQIKDGSIDSDYKEIWTQTWSGLRKDIPPIKQEIEDQFRNLLGLETKID